MQTPPPPPEGGNPADERPEQHVLRMLALLYGSTSAVWDGEGGVVCLMYRSRPKNDVEHVERLKSGCFEPHSEAMGHSRQEWVTE